MKFNTLGDFLKNFSETRGYTLEYIGLKTGKTKEKRETNPIKKQETIENLKLFE